MTAVATQEADRQFALFRTLEEQARFPERSLGLLGLTLTNPDLTFDEWQNIGRIIAHAGKWAPWALGDWLNFGADLYGEVYSQATEPTRKERYDIAARVTGLAPGTLANYGSIAARIPISRRRVELEMSVHEPAARLEPAEQDEWLQRCVDECWSREEFRRAINEAKTPHGAVVAGEPAAEEEGYIGVSFNDRLLEVAHLLYHKSQRTSDGSVIVPADAWAQLVSLLGRD